MQDIADKDSIIFALNKQLSSLKNFLQSQELLINPADLSVINQSSVINQNLSQIQQLALLQKQDAIRKNRESNGDFSSMISYFGAPNQFDSTTRRGKRTTKRSATRKCS